MTRPNYDSVLCRVLFKLGRDHTWGSPAPIDDFLQGGFTQQEREVAQDEIVPDIKRGQVEYIGYQNGTIWLRGDKHDEAAYFLRDNCGYEEYRIEATLSRFDGFD
ncbi:hypothetical protein Htur_5266 (plasmid) [Haloterrigena turkmenica DSM 5511]|uniref:Uncharacterized protein n=1 Tax=Haloterrigena turkmenica (strain ATCC 51198 / DSM 5511 / JCM 9101 / NCIMB 13204 / VKM B-1734 / 4k) TaxID=543526 RepID=D2S3P7_HALTV|nr:hypothetical protein [Haloterrigena turkmenica]ADB63994.1 hypothetical protein Htur_5266 [Haloterrigena turkmenica DSM 5511]